MKKRSGKLARRYARALLRTVVAKSGEDRVLVAVDGLERFSVMYLENEPFRIGLISPMFEREARKSALQRVLESLDISGEVASFLFLAFDRDRLPVVPEIAVALREFANELSRVVEVEVVTAQPLDAQEQGEIQGSLEKLIEGKLLFVWFVQPEIIGGMIVRYNGKIVDGSIKGRLESIKRELLTHELAPR